MRLLSCHNEAEEWNMLRAETMGIAEQRSCRRRCLDFTSAQIGGGIAHHFIEVANEDDDRTDRHQLGRLVPGYSQHSPRNPKSCITIVALEIDTRSWAFSTFEANRATGSLPRHSKGHAMPLRHQTDKSLSLLFCSPVARWHMIDMISTY